MKNQLTGISTRRERSFRHVTGVEKIVDVTMQGSAFYGHVTIGGVVLRPKKIESAARGLLRYPKPISQKRTGWFRSFADTRREKLMRHSRSKRSYGNALQEKLMATAPLIPLASFYEPATFQWSDAEFEACQAVQEFNEACDGDRTPAAD